MKRESRIKIDTHLRKQQARKSSVRSVPQIPLTASQASVPSGYLVNNVMFILPAQETSILVPVIGMITNNKTASAV